MVVVWVVVVGVWVFAQLVVVDAQLGDHRDGQVMLLKMTTKTLVHHAPAQIASR